ncbi:MAG: 3'-5' exonuclease [Nitrospirae bacterium]|nr:3'-5' exonuclease [Nitrospirota bacterium]
MEITTKIPTTFIAIDIETTGLSAVNDKIIEISAVKFHNRRHIDDYTRLINPQRSISYHASQVNGIDDSMVCNAPKFNDIIDELLDFIGDAPLIGHNIKLFDIGFIQKELGLVLNNPIIDTLPLSRQAFPFLENHQLMTLQRYLKIETSVNHRAYDDALSTGYLYIRCLQEL